MLYKIVTFMISNFELVLSSHFSNGVDLVIDTQLYFFKFSELIAKDLECFVWTPSF